MPDPLDIPENAVFVNTVTGEEIRVADAGRLEDGTYVLDVSDITDITILELKSWEPEVRNSMAISYSYGEGAALLSEPRIHVYPGHSLSMSVYYFNANPPITLQDSARRQPTSRQPRRSPTTISIRVRGCDQRLPNVYKEVITDVCTTPLDAPDNAKLEFDNGTVIRMSDQPRAYDGTYQVDASFIDSLAIVNMRNWAPSVRDRWVAIAGYGEGPVVLETPAFRVYPGRNVTIDVLYFYLNTTTKETSSSRSSSSTGTLTLTLRGCDAGIVTVTDCTTPLDANDGGYVVNVTTGQRFRVADFGRRDDGTYILELPEGMYVLDGFAPEIRSNFFVQTPDGQAVSYNRFAVIAGVTTSLYVLYY